MSKINWEKTEAGQWMRMNNSQVLAKVRIMTTQMKKSQNDSLIDKRKREGLARAVCASESHATLSRQHH